ncbi:hypothetical protein J3E68DRAFT_353899 [Trichoderma sp. SZMC 28012]
MAMASQISLWFYKISKRPNEQFSTGRSTVFYFVLRYVILQALLISMLVPQQKKKVRHRSRCPVPRRYCKLQGWGVHIRRNATKKHQRSEPIPSSPPLLPVPAAAAVPLLSKGMKLRGRRRSRKKETNDLLTPFSPGPDRQNGPSPACSRVTRNGPLQTRKTPPSFPLAVRRRGHTLRRSKLPQHRKNRASFGVWNRARYYSRRDQVTMRITYKGRK